MKLLSISQTIYDYFQAFGKHHVQKATELLRRSQMPGQDQPLDLSDASSKPFDAQAHVIAAFMKMLDETRSGILAALMGTGKTLVGMLTFTSTPSTQPGKAGVMAAIGRSCSDPSI